MPGTEHEAARKRTAVIVVHGIGSQRALETVRGVIRAVWQDSDNAIDPHKRIWTHPESTATDIDLAVMTTNTVPGTKRVVDFHELYWAHLMSETKAVAVLLWLFELARKGPNMKPGMNGLWWSGAIFVCLLTLSLTLLILQGISMFSRTTAETMIVAPFLLLLSSIATGLLIALRYLAWRLVTLLGVLCAAGLAIYAGYLQIENAAVPMGRGFLGLPDLITMTTLPLLVALVAIHLLMGQHGLRAFWWIVFVSAIVFLLVLHHRWNPTADLARNLMNGWRPWSLDSNWSQVVAWTIVGFYLAANAAFLQPYLGDAARYFRGSPANVAVRREIRKQAVDLLDRLHASGRYDRIIVVAHSLGSVIAYDMLRAYFSRICDELPRPSELGAEVAEIDRATWQPAGEASKQDKKSLREKARKAVASMAAVTDAPTSAGPRRKSWLVTDFVTLGAALTHANFLMCVGKSEPDLQKDFARRVSEREFPTCPPALLDNDGVLSFINPRTGQREFHHGALFGLTRWTNIYFPLEQVFWGDAIGGPLAPIFGSHIADVAVSTRTAGGADFFTHTAYWKTDCPEGWKAPHIAALRKAVDLADTGAAIDLIENPPKA